MHPLFIVVLIWTSAVSLIIFANYLHHKAHKQIHSIEDDQEFWDNSPMYDDLFLNQNN